MFRTFFLRPMMGPVASVVLVWQVIFHARGTLNQFLELFGVQGADWLKSPYCQLVIVVLFLWKNLGYNMILFMAGLSAIPREILEVAKLESATDWQIFWSIKLRYLSSSLMFVTIMSLINSFKVFREIYLLTGDHPYGSLYMLQHFINNNLSSLDYQKVSSAAILMSIVMVCIIALLLMAENRAGRDLES
jgi:multiple sugar transport system permease protein